MKKLLLFFSLLSISIYASCTDDILQNDVYYVQNSSITGVYNGKAFAFDFSHFKLCEDQQLIAYDTIALYKEVQTLNTNFEEIEKVEQLSVRHEGPFEIHRCIYKTAFIVFISSWTHEPYYRYLPFKFEAEELWLEGKQIAQQPLFFVRTDSELTNFPLDEWDNDLTSKHLINFEITSFCSGDNTKIASFSYKYYVAYNKHTVWDDCVISNNKTSVIITYDWHPE